jgi:hypothetical protein
MEQLKAAASGSLLFKKNIFPGFDDHAIHNP